MGQWFYLFIYLFSFCREGKALQSGVWLACTSIEWRSAGIYKPVWRPEAEEGGRQFIRAFKNSNSLMQLKYNAIGDPPAGKCATLYALWINDNVKCCLCSGYIEQHWALQCRNCKHAVTVHFSSHNREFLCFRIPSIGRRVIREFQRLF